MKFTAKPWLNIDLSGNFSLCFSVAGYFGVNHTGVGLTISRKILNKPSTGCLEYVFQGVAFIQTFPLLSTRCMLAPRTGKTVKRAEAVPAKCFTGGLGPVDVANLCLRVTGVGLLGVSVRQRECLIKLRQSWPASAKDQSREWA